jgi:hypothetical protein
MQVGYVLHWLTKVEFWHVDDLDCCGSDEAFPHLDREVAALRLRLGNANQHHPV